MEKQIAKLIERFSEIESLLGQPEAVSDQERYRKLTQEHAYLSDVKEAWNHYSKIQSQIAEDKKLLKTETDEELIAMLQEELEDLTQKLTLAQNRVETLLVPPDPNDSKNTIVEIRAGTGGDEAALFVGDVARMYQLYAVKNGWKLEPLSYTESDVGGYKEYICALTGKDVHRMMQYEAGTHRVQRVPETETQGRVHTSAITIAVLMEPDEQDAIKLDERDLKIDTYRASGAGGQHVNTTDSAVRITHIPTGTVAYCQQERSQIKNREKALRLLSAKIAEEERKKQMKMRSELRQSQVGTGDRSERIRTYNYPQNRVSDHRIDLTLYKLDRILEGDLEEITEPLVAHFHQLKLTQSQ